MSSLVKRLCSSQIILFSIALLFLAATPQVAQAGLIIDAFNPTSAFVVPLTGSGSNNTGTILGSIRTFSGNMSGPLGARMVASGGFAAISADALTTATGTMRYDGSGVGLGSLLPNNQFKLTVGVDLSGYEATLAVRTGGTDYLSSFIVPQGSFSDVFVPFSNFGAANFANVDSIELRLNTMNTVGTRVAEADFVIRNFSAVPEPSSILLTLGLGMAGLYPRRRRA